MVDVFRYPALASEAEINETIFNIANKYRGARARSIGETVCERQIYAVEIGNMNNPAIFVGGTHGMEWASTLVTLKLCAEACEEYNVTLRDALSRRGAVFVPLLNPDGFELRRRGRAAAAARARALSRFPDADFAFWQSNSRGVDLNRNFDASFWEARRAAAEYGVNGASPTRFGGPFPFSERETRAIKKAIAMYRPRTLYALHSQGEEIYWRYADRMPKESRYIAEVLSALSGYKLCDPETVALGAGLKDWFIKKYNRPGFTIELGLGKNPLPYCDFDEIYQKVRRMLFVALII